ncbi:anti-sigma F factor antagonist [Clostridia bacterium]|nr:anti-sigma F factor antagonist [Clostridia bacterium]
MKITSTHTDNTLYVRLDGDIDHHSSRSVREEVDRLIAASGAEIFELDLSEVDFMDSSGLGLVLGRYKKQTESGGKMKIINPSERILRILRLAGIEKIIKIERVNQ